MIIENELYGFSLYMKNIYKNEVQSISLTGNGLVKTVVS